MRYVHLLLLVLIAQPITAQNTILWSVSHPEIQHRSYLLGTYHQTGNSFVDSIPEIFSAMNECQLAIFESIDPREKLIDLLNKRDDDLSYLKHLKPRDLATLQAMSAKWPVQPQKLRPMELLTKLRQEYFKTQCGSVLPTDTADHMDTYIRQRAQQRDLQIMGLETDSLQTEFIARMAADPSWEQLAKPINEAIVDLVKGRDTKRRCSFSRSYHCLSLDYQLDETCGESELIKGRNATWMDILPDLLADQACLISVGLFHLYGDCGLIMQLRDLGFTVEPVEMEANKAHCP